MLLFSFSVAFCIKIVQYSLLLYQLLQVSSCFIRGCCFGFRHIVLYLAAGHFMYLCIKINRVYACRFGIRLLQIISLRYSSVISCLFSLLFQLLRFRSGLFSHLLTSSIVIRVSHRKPWEIDWLHCLFLYCLLVIANLTSSSEQVQLTKWNRMLREKSFL